MKIINRDYGYQFDCSIKGKILVTKREWAKIIRYLLHPRTSFNDSYYNTFYKDMLRKDILKGRYCKQGILVNIKVHCTRLVIEKFGYTGMKYKTLNYMFLIKK